MEVFAAFFIVGFFVAVMVGGSLLDGWVLSKLWAWFMVPIFHMPALSVPQSIGIALVIGYLTKQYSNAKEEDDPKKTRTFWALMLVKPFLALLIGFIVKHYI